MIKAKLKQGVSLIILLPAVALQAQGFKQLYLSNQAASEPYLFLLSHSANCGTWPRLGIVPQMRKGSRVFWIESWIDNAAYNYALLYK